MFPAFTTETTQSDILVDQMINSDLSSMILYRPVGLEELALIYDSGMRAFPARLPKQPIFYPVLDLEYARKTASKWNVKNGQFAGYVTEFRIEDEYINKFEKHSVGKSQHQEFWIPAEEVEEFNKYIVGHIKVVEAYFGEAFQGFIPEQFGLQGKNAAEQFTLLTNSYLYKRMDFYVEIKRNHKAIFLNYPFWQKHNFKNPGLKEKILQAIKEAWFTSFPKIPLVPPLHEDAKPENDTDSNLAANLADENIPPAKQEPLHSSVKPAGKDLPPAKERSSQSAEKPVHKGPVRLKPRDTHFSIKPIHEDVQRLNQKASLSSMKPVDKNETPPEQAKPSPSVEPVSEAAAPVEQRDSQLLANPVHEEAAPSRQTGLHFVQGVQVGLRGQYHEAIDELSRAVEEDADSAVAHTSLGVAFHRVGEDDRALACYETALKINPRFAEAYYFRSNILYEHGDVREAITGYTMAIGLDPELIDAHQKPVPQDRLTDYTSTPAEMYRLARSAYRILDLNKFLEANPGQANLFKARAAEYSRLWNYERAIADYGTSLKIQPDDPATLHLRGLAYEQLGQHDRALDDYQKAIAINPQLSGVYINRGIAFGKTGNFRQSIASLSEGIRLNPDSPDGYFNRGVTYFKQGDLERALEDFTNVIRLSPKDETAYYWRGISNEEIGRQKAASADYKQFLNLSQDSRLREEIEQRLRQWNEGSRSDANGRDVIPQDRQKTNHARSEKPDQQLDLYDLIVALGERALNSMWFGVGVDCYGEKAEELYAFTDHNNPIPGRELLQIASGIRQTIEGDFTAFDADADSHWLFIRAWDGSGFYIETNDPKSRELLNTHFRSVEEVPDVDPPYEGLFIHV